MDDQSQILCKIQCMTCISYSARILINAICYIYPIVERRTLNKRIFKIVNTSQSALPYAVDIMNCKRKINSAFSLYQNIDCRRFSGRLLKKIKFWNHWGLIRNLTHCNRLIEVKCLSCCMLYFEVTSIIKLKICTHRTTQKLILKQKSIKYSFYCLIKHSVFLNCTWHEVHATKHYQYISKSSESTKQQNIHLKLSNTLLIIHLVLITTTESWSSNSFKESGRCKTFNCQTLMEIS